MSNFIFHTALSNVPLTWRIALAQESVQREVYQSELM